MTVEVMSADHDAPGVSVATSPASQDRPLRPPTLYFVTQVVLGVKSHSDHDVKREKKLLEAKTIPG